MLRAVLWGITGDRVKASRWASRAGQVVAWTLILVGVMSALRGALLQGVWLVLIGSFLNTAARSSYQHLLVQEALGSLRVGRVMRRRVEWVQAQSTVDELLREHLFVSEQRAFPVDAQGVLAGVVSFDDVRRVPQSAWHDTKIAEIMTPRDELVVLSRHATALEALELLVARDINQILVLDGHDLVGLVQRSDLLTLLALKERG